MKHFRNLEQERQLYRPKLPKVLENLAGLILKREDKAIGPQSPEIMQWFPCLEQQTLVTALPGEPTHVKPLKVGIVLSGGPAGGAHNVIAGVFDAIKTWDQDSQLIGFLGGPSGIIDNHSKELTAPVIERFRNTGGFNLLGSGRTKIETDVQFEKCLATAASHGLDSIIIVGGDDSNTNAVLLANYFRKMNSKTCIVGVPKTIDGDLKNEWVEISFGFDTASKTYAELVGNIMRDALSQEKYYFFIKVMGRTASHLVLEAALQTQPNLALISEEVAEKKYTLYDLVTQITDLVVQRSQLKKDYGVILFPEGLIEFIPEFNQLISEINRLYQKSNAIELSALPAQLSPEMATLFRLLPKETQEQLLFERDPHGNIQVSKIETERLFIHLVNEALKTRTLQGDYKGKFNAQPLFFGYEGRSCYPSNFDCNYCYALGITAALLSRDHMTGYMAAVNRLSQPVELWTCHGIPLTEMLDFVQRKGKRIPVIAKSLVNLQGAPFCTYALRREEWKLKDCYLMPGPIQFFGPEALTDSITLTLGLEHQSEK